MPIAYWKGKHLYEETKHKISSALKGRRFAEEHKKRISEGLKRAYNEGHGPSKRGRVAWNKGLSKETDLRVKAHAEKLLGKKPTQNQLRGLEKGRGWNKGKPLSEEHKQKLSEANKGREPPNKGKKCTWITKLNKDPAFIKRRLKGLLKRPTKPETRVIDVIREYSLPYRYVGDGKVIIGGKCPDFINNNGAKRIIEVFGDYWHTKKARCFEETEQGRREFFAKYGFETLILWESQINRMSDAEIAETIERFEV